MQARQATAHLAHTNIFSADHARLLPSAPWHLQRVENLTPRMEGERWSNSLPTVPASDFFSALKTGTSANSRAAADAAGASGGSGRFWKAKKFGIIGGTGTSKQLRRLEGIAFVLIPLNAEVRIFELLALRAF